MAMVTASYKVTLEVEVEDDATDDDVRDAYLDMFEEWVNQGGVPYKDDIKLEL